MTNSINFQALKMNNPVALIDLGGATPTTHLAVDLLQPNYKSVLLSRFHTELLVPRVAHKCEEDGSFRLQLPAEVYRVESLNLFILSVRSPVQENKLEQFATHIAEWTQSLGVKDVITLSSELDYSAQFVDPYSGAGGLALVCNDLQVQSTIAQKCGLISLSDNLQSSPLELLGGVAERIYQKLKDVRLISLLSLAFNPAASVPAAADLFKKVVQTLGLLREGEANLESMMEKLNLEEGELKIPKNWKLLGLYQ